VPIDEGWLYADNFRVEASNEVLEIATSPHDVATAVVKNTSTNVFNEVALVASHNFRLPPGDGRMIILTAEDFRATDITNTLTINSGDDGGYTERWITLRGAE